MVEKIQNPKNNPLTLVVFGATGDLYQNKLSLALFNLFTRGLLPENFSIIGFGRRQLSNLEFQNFTKDAILSRLHNASSSQRKNLENFIGRVSYIKGDLKNLKDFQNLAESLNLDDKKRNLCTNKLFYLAVPPSLYGVIFKNISHAGLTVPCAPGAKKIALAWTRVLVEKPFGQDINDARHLDNMLGKLFDESQVFRIDHYLAKQIVRDILDFRFGGAAPGGTWSNKNIEKVRIIFHESGTVANRGSFYDGIGALCDVGQNHMLQMLALIAMENPKSMDAKGIQNARAKILRKVFLVNKTRIIRGQYEGYLNEKNVKAESKTETFFRLVLGVDSERWRGTPFEFEGGKALLESEVFIEVCFKKVNTCLKFSLSSNKVAMFDAYEKVFYDCLLGDQTIFASSGEVAAEWAVTTEIIKKWKSIPLVIYKKGSRAEGIK